MRGSNHYFSAKHTAERLARQQRQRATARRSTRRWHIRPRWDILRLALLGGFFVGMISAISPALGPAAASGEAGATARLCTAVDGDTLRCGSERIRLIGIDTPEMPGHCREGRACVAGDPFAAQRSLTAALGGSMQIERYGQDAYGRTLALVSGSKGDLSCRQWRAGHAIYRADWDVGGRLKARCR